MQVAFSKKKLMGKDFFCSRRHNPGISETRANFFAKTSQKDLDKANSIIILFNGSINKFNEFEVSSVRTLAWAGLNTKKIVKTLAVIIFIVTALPAYADAKEDCSGCHNRKGAAYYVDKKLYAESVHGQFPCEACHINITGYPHGKVSPVKCMICHFTGNLGAPTVKDFKESVHGKALAAGNPKAPTCQICHGSHAILPAKEALSNTSRSKVPELCSQCHMNEFQEYRRSIHGKEFYEKKNEAAAVCIDCHMEHHNIESVAKPDWKLYVINECGGCHAEQLSTYRKTFHGKVTKLGFVTVAKCSDCHGSHKILPRAEKDSAISEGNIVMTCGKCHPGSGASFAKFYAHPEESDRAKYPVLFYVYFFMTALLISVFTFFFIHTILWSYRALRERMKGGTEEK